MSSFLPRPLKMQMKEWTNSYSDDIAMNKNKNERIQMTNSMMMLKYFRMNNDPESI